MEFPEIWLYLGTFLTHVFFVQYPDLLSGLQIVIDSFTVEQCAELATFLADVNGGGLSKAELIQIWMESGTEILPDAENIGSTFTQLQQMAQPPS